MPRVVRHAQRTRVARLAVDPEPRDQRKEVAGRLSGEPHEPRSIHFAEIALDLVRFVLESGIDLSAVPTGGAPSRFVSLEQRHCDTPLGEVQCRRKTRVAGADDRDFGPRIRPQRRRRHGGPRCRHVQAVRLGAPERGRRDIRARGETHGLLPGGTALWRPIRITVKKIDYRYITIDFKTLYGRPCARSNAKNYQ